MEKWSILSDVVKYVQYDQYTIGLYKLRVQVPEDRYEMEMYRRLQKSKIEVKEVRFNSNLTSLSRNT